MSYEAHDWYDSAVYYDIIFDVETEEEVDFLEAVHAQHGTGRTRGRRVLEPACGSGRLVAGMARRGWSVTGFDASDGMLDFARQRLRDAGLRARLKRDRLESFTVAGGPFDLAHCLVSTFKYISSEADATAHLRRVARALRPGGLYVIGLHLADYPYRGASRERWVASRDGIEVVCNTQIEAANPRTRTEAVRSRLRVQHDGAERRFETRWTFRTYSARQLKTLLARVPSFEHVATYDFTYDMGVGIPLDGERLDVVVVVKKKARRH